MAEPCRPPAGARARLRLLATTDLHMNLTSYDYYADRADPTVGLTRTATLIHQARTEAERDGRLVLLFDNGDGLQGSPLAEAAAADPGKPHPLMRAFDQLHYDAIGLGNHDFNFGLKPLTQALEQAPCPVLNSNLSPVSPESPPGFSPFALLDRTLRSGDRDWPIRIGVLSFVPPQTVKWDAHVLQGRIRADDIVESARRWVPELRSAGCDLILALAHTGFSSATDHPDLENAALPLAAVDGIDAVIAGHTHLRLPGPDHGGLPHVDPDRGAVHGKPAVMAGTFGSHLGIIDLELIASEDRKWRPAGFECTLRPIVRRAPSGRAGATVREDPALVRLMADSHARTRALMDEPVGRVAQDLHSYFTFFAPDRALALVAAAQAAALRPLLAGSPAEDLPLLSAASPGKFGARSGPGFYTDVPAGEISLRNVADLHVFPNELAAVLVSGAQLLDWIEMSASLFRQVGPGKTGQDLVDTAMPGHDFDVMHGLCYQIDLSAPARFFPDGTLRGPGGRRLRNVTCNGTPVQPDDRFAVALNSFRANGGGPFAALAGAERIKLPSLSVRDAIRQFVAGPSGDEPLHRAPPPWGFCPMAGASVAALTGPGAEAHLAELKPRGISVRGLTRDGFLELDIPL
ncbi:bifunctional 2',3'-cyclic-nucleotide 2'-phosphodiesterase/3'-nucleotidase [Sedimentitalea sp. JM2-8]|uniref:Bifunctional 2',3'-cyclic-nucleotide 2'-phosphodiesterase/3'-nucleotidase n=1 Tax=Sedimentitalea xiamensis TaxID=3050037 RepID=A0ABT7FFN4_9RHOB|nr:bifunctional 2',3'-cyclic-nucleotide 2'-phosphodiesterase/3'-nucleotidase [Sedimentitalea xiamensis]MDK3073954.1 bifunctional 2',3'-cyclic-nucleotide 2'-phosphodiesterase/3'-nucleotidase [Sedimentitalea xiamensis]